MSITRRLRTIMCCTVLEIGALMGMPMRAEQIQELMHAMNVPNIARTDPEESPSGDPFDGNAIPDEEG